MKTIISLCDYSGEWSRPYLNAGYTVIRVDPKLDESVFRKSERHGCDVTMGLTAQGYRDSNGFRQLADSGNVHGLLMAPPCTDFSGSGARWWSGKDADGRTEASMEIIDACIDIVAAANPAWWVLENPAGRLPRLYPNSLGKPAMYFHPCDYGDPYTKKTALWGEFNTDLKKKPVEPIMYTDKNGKRGSWFWAKLGGKSERTKTLRSNTPPGFALAFFKANP